MESSALLEPMQAAVFPCVWLCKRKENDSSAELEGYRVGLAQAAGATHFANGQRLVESCLLTEPFLKTLLITVIRADPAGTIREED